MPKSLVFRLVSCIVVLATAAELRISVAQSFGDVSPSQIYQHPRCMAQTFISKIAISHDDQWVLGSLNPGEVRLWSIDTGDVIHTFQHEVTINQITDVAFSPDDQLVATADRSSAKVWNVASGSLLWTFPNEILGTTTTFVDFLPHIEQLMVSNANGARIWDLGTGELIHFFPGANEEISWGFAGLSPDGRYITTNDKDTAEAFVWEVTTGTLLRRFPNARRFQMPISFVNSTEIAFNEGETLSFWNILSGQRTGMLPLGEGRIKEWRFSPNGDYALIFSNNGQTANNYATELWLWDVELHQKIYSFDPSFLLWNSIFLPDEETLLALLGNDDGEQILASVWNIPLRETTESFPIGTYTDRLITSAVTSDGLYWVTATADYHLSVWDLQTGERLRILC